MTDGLNVPVLIATDDCCVSVNGTCEAFSLHERASTKQKLTFLRLKKP